MNGRPFHVFMVSGEVGEPAAGPAAAAEGSVPPEAMLAPALPSRIESVTVYRQGALVTRVAEIAADAEGRFPRQVRITGLPLCVDDGSLRTQVEPVGEGTPPAAIEARVALDVPEVDTTLEPATDAKLDEARREVARIGARIEALDHALKALEAVGIEERPEAKEGEPPIPSPVEARLALVEFRDARLAVLQEERRTLMGRLEQARKNEEDLRRRREAASTARQARENELRKAAIVGLDGQGASAGRARLSVEYLVPGARWAPSYAVRFAPGFGQADLSVRGVVAQRTGEDWTNVRLTLSSAEPVAWTALPELKSQRISRRRAERPKVGFRPPPPGAEELFADHDRAFAPVPAAPPVGAGFAALPPPCEPPPCPPPCVQPCPVPSAPECDAELAENTAPMMGGAPAAAAGYRAPGPELARSLRTASAAPSPRQARKRAAAPSAAMDHRPMAPAPKEIQYRMEAAAVPPQEFFAPPPPTDLEPAADLLDYGRLRMPPPSAPGRGKLSPVPASELSLELLSEVRVAISFEVTTVVAAAIRTASEVAGRPLPTECVPPVSSEGFDYAFSTDAPVDVASDGTFHLVQLFAREARARLIHVAVPRESSQAFRVAQFDNPLDGPLPFGPIDVSVGSDFLLTGRLQTTTPRAAVELGLGVEQGIKIARNTRFEEHTTGILAGTLSAHHEITIDVANMLADKAVVDVRERVPRPATDKEEVTVEMGKIDPPWERFEPRDAPLAGGYRWKLSLAPGEKRTLSASYDVKLSARCEVDGGNRRE